MPKIKITREKLYETVFYSLIKKGYHGTSIDCIAKQLGIGNAAIYHYGHKLDIFLNAIFTCENNEQRGLAAFRMALDMLDNYELCAKLCLLIAGMPHGIYLTMIVRRLRTQFE